MLAAAPTKILWFFGGNLHNFPLLDSRRRMERNVVLHTSYHPVGYMQLEKSLSHLREMHLVLVGGLGAGHVPLSIWTNHYLMKDVADNNTNNMFGDDRNVLLLLMSKAFSE
jgi:hypothetical protein